MVDDKVRFLRGLNLGDGSTTTSEISTLLQQISSQTALKIYPKEVRMSN